MIFKNGFGNVFYHISNFWLFISCFICYYSIFNQLCWKSDHFSWLNLHKFHIWLLFKVHKNKCVIGIESLTFSKSCSSMKIKTVSEVEANYEISRCHQKNKLHQLLEMIILHSDLFRLDLDLAEVTTIWDTLNDIKLLYNLHTRSNVANSRYKSKKSYCTPIKEELSDEVYGHDCKTFSN